MMLLVVETFVVEYLEEGCGNEKDSEGVQPASLEGIAVEQLVTTGKGHALW